MQNRIGLDGIGSHKLKNHQLGMTVQETVASSSPPLLVYREVS